MIKSELVQIIAGLVVLDEHLGRVAVGGRRLLRHDDAAASLEDIQSHVHGAPRQRVPQVVRVLRDEVRADVPDRSPTEI